MTARMTLLKVPVLLRPKLPIDGAAFEQRVMRPDIHDLARIQDENLVAVCQR